MSDGRLARVRADWDTHPVLVTESAHHDWRVTDTWHDDDAVLLRLAPQQDGTTGLTGRPGLYAVGTPVAAARLILVATRDRPISGRDTPIGRTTVPRGTRAALASLATSSHAPVPPPFDVPADAAWDWWCTEHAPERVDGEDHVEEVTDIAQVRAVLAVANPAGELVPGTPRARWWGWRDDRGTLRAIVGADRRVPGAPWVLGSIGTDPAWRGRGIATATTAVAVRAGLTEAPLVALGMYADNTAGRRTYERVGFTLVQEFESSA